MQRPDNETTNPDSDLTGVDARSAGWALSGVTMLVLVVGLLVIRSTRSETNDPEPIGSQRAAVAEVPLQEPRQRTIVLEPAALPEEDLRRTDPRVLPAIGTATPNSGRSPRSASAGRPATEPVDRF